MVGEGSRVEVEGTAAPREGGGFPGATTFPGGHHLPRALGQRRGFSEPHPTEGPELPAGQPAPSGPEVCGGKSGREQRCPGVRPLRPEGEAVKLLSLGLN